MSDEEKPKPAWIKETFAHYDLCCRQSTNKKLCMRARPSQIDGQPLGTLRPTPTPPVTYFVDSVTGMCVSDLEKPMPNHITSSFDDYNRCCIVESRDPEKCLENELLSDSHSSGPSPVPPPVFYLLDSTGLCVNENDFPMPYPVENTYEDYDTCCKSSGTWKEDECLAQKPTMSPSNFPTWSPSTPWPTETEICPESYDPSGSTKYRRNDEIEVNLVVYRCMLGAYCNMAKFQPPQEDPGAEPETKNNGIPVTNVKGKDNALWREAWERLNICVYTPTAYPTKAPNSPAPTCKTRWHPGDVKKRICTNSANYPSIWSEDPIMRVAYFTDTSDECCNKFYSGKRCRIRDEC